MRHLWLVLSRQCNLACRYCYQGSDHARAGIVARGLQPMMTAEIMERALPWALGWTDDELLLTLYGGEPLLAWPLVRGYIPAWQEAFGQAGKRLRITCTTNGTLLREPVRRFFDEHQLGVLLSLDGPPWIHDQQRVHANGSPSWEAIRPEKLLAWRPNLEIVWQLDPATVVTPMDLDWMIARGFKRINFNLNWLVRWPAEAQLWLSRFMEAVFLRFKAETLQSNWVRKLEKALTIDQREEEPCGNGRQMLALTPEGWLYPSQEMAFDAFEPGRAPGTAEYYRVGDVRATPVIDPERLRTVGDIRNDQMRPPAGYACGTCVAESMCFGGCHCRYVGQDGSSPENRFDVMPGVCESTIAAVAGLLRGAAISRHVRSVEWMAGRAAQAIRSAGTRTARSKRSVEVKCAQHGEVRQQRAVGLAGWGR